MHRRSWLFSALYTVASAVVLFAGASVVRADEPVSLEDRLKAGLRCRRPEEFAFVKTVVQHVEQGKLKPDLVLSTLQWAVAQRPNFPFYYFQYGLRRRAAALGVEI